MTVIVQKYGGSSLADISCIQKVAQKIKKACQRHRLLVVVSAMAGETDRLGSLAKKITASPSARELDVLLATGEQAAASLVAMALQDCGVLAKSYLGLQVPIVTDGVHNQARIMHIDVNRIKQDLQEGWVVIIAGFQGRNKIGEITTLGRGGSDTTAVALAAALGAKECQIYTDVEGVFTTDPRLVPEAQRMDQVAIQDMLELAGSGAKVLQNRAVEFAEIYQVPVRVLSSFIDGPGTLVTAEPLRGQDSDAVTGISFCAKATKISVRGVPAETKGMSGFLQACTRSNIDIDMMTHTVLPNNVMNIAFTVKRQDSAQARQTIEELAMIMKVQGVYMNDHVSKISIIGVGIRSRAQVISRLFSCLERIGIDIQMVTTSEIKVSVIIDEKYLEVGVKTLHESFCLDVKPAEVVN